MIIQALRSNNLNTLFRFNHIPKFQSRSFTASVAAMASFDINSKIKLPSGYEIPRLGYGVYQTPAAEAEEVTDHAIRSGYKHVDSATMYKNEQPSSTGMLKSGVPRDQLYFTSKVPPQEINYEAAKKAVDESLKKTGLVR